MFSPQFMGYIIDPKSTPESGYKVVPTVYDDKNIKSDIAGIKDSADKLAVLNKDVFDKFKTNVDKYDSVSKQSETQTAFSAIASAIPGVRRVSSEANTIKDGNYGAALGMLFLGLINVEEDFRDFKTMGKQIMSKGTASAINPKTTSLKFSFFRGTLLEPIFQKYKVTKAFMDTFNKTLLDFKPIKKLIKSCDKTLRYRLITEEKELSWGLSKIFKKMPEKTLTTVNYIKISEGKALSKLAVRSLARIPVLNLLVSAVIELPAIVKAYKNGDGNKQIGRSTIKIASFTAGGAVIGALLSSCFGPAGSIIGLGVGSWLGSVAGKKISNSLIGESIESKKHNSQNKEITGMV